ncbi:MAG: hypothetical protein IPJ60_12700 [Sphingobacteriaceae bacterium]|nr:hypothetical protein [Sphingobacteriaceae bacterium]
MTTRTLNIFILTLGILFDIKSQTADTINFIDSNNKKQGQWIYTGKNRPGTCYKPDQKAEEGKYKDNRKIGIWTEYFCNGNIKNILTFKDGRPEGPAKLFYESGKIKEDGTWQNNRWVGKCKMYTEDGKVQEYTFEQKGRREGMIIYPFEKGTVIQGRFSNSPDSIKEYKEVDKKDTLKPK